jgi:hypothetical protein
LEVGSLGERVVFHVSVELFVLSQLVVLPRLPPVPEVCLIYLEFLGANPERKLRDLQNLTLGLAE